MASKRFGNFQPKQPSSSAYKKARLDIEIIPSQQYVQRQQQQQREREQQAQEQVKTPTTVVKSSSKTDYLWGDEDDEFIILASQAVEEVEMFQQTQGGGMGDVTFGRFSKESVPSSTQQQQQPNSCDLMPPPPVPVEIAGPSSRTRAVTTEVIDLLADSDDDVFSEQFDDNYDNIEKHLDEFFNNDFDDDFNMSEFRRSSGKEEGAKEQEVESSQEEEEHQQQDQLSQKSSSPVKPSIKPVCNGESSRSKFKLKLPQSVVRVSETTVDRVNGTIFPSQQQHQQQQRHHQTQIDREALQNAAKKKDHAKDLQVKFLTNQLEMAKKKTELLQKDYNEVMERVQIRDGEVSMLRYELKNVKSHNDQLRMEKMKESETLKKDWVEKMKDLEKVIVAQKSELEFKALEMMNIKSKRLNNSFRVDPEGSSVAREEPVTEKDFKIHNHWVEVFQPVPAVSYEIDTKIFEISAESISKFNINNRISNFSKGDAVLSQHLGHLQASLSQLVCLKASFPQQSIPTIAQVTMQALIEIEKYCNRLQLVRVKDAHLGPKVAFDFLCKNSKKCRLEGSVNIFQKDLLFHGEKAVIQRRFLAALGLLCRYVPSLAESLVEESNDCISVLNKALGKISYASDLYGHMGLIAAAGSLLCALTHHVRQLKQNGHKLMYLFKALVYCRPDSALILTHLSETLYRISGDASSSVVDLLDALCWQSGSTNFAVNDAYKMIQFTKDSCILQIYAVLLETSVPQNRTLSSTEIRHLVTNTRNTVYFLRNSLARPVGWLRQFFHRPESALSQCCQCHIRITNTFVILLHQVLRCWTHCPLNIELNTMLQITQNGVLLLFDLFETIYRGEILHVGGHAVQSRLQATYNWLVQHQNDFRFQPTHKTALHQLDLRLVMEEPLKSSDDEDHQKNRMDVDRNPADSAELERRDMYDDLYEEFFTSKLLRP